MKPVTHSLLLVSLALGFAQCCLQSAEDEFVGPFPSWRNLKRDYGAQGDGKADDTLPLQRALDDLTRHADFCVLYMPAGVYRLTDTVRTIRKAHTDCQGVAIVGEDPVRTVLRWDGSSGAKMFQWDAWYSRISRLTFDGTGRARVGLFYGPAFSTYNETSDITFRDVTIGLLFGEDQTNGQAENEVLRCRFERCSEAGVVTCNWNSMDIWVWYSRFEDCGHGLLNMMGNFHAWQNLFLRSRVADIATRNLMVFSFVNNVSIGSRRFIDFDTGHTWGSPVSISGNRVVNHSEDFAVKLGNAGPYLVMDNVFRLPPGSTNRAVKLTWADQTLAGNAYSSANAVFEQGRFRRVAERIEAPGRMDASPPELPSTPRRVERKIIEVPPGSNTDAIQQAINQAASQKGSRPVVHLPMGVYGIDRTIVVPSECDLEVIGDGAGETATRLNWSGAEGGLVLRLEGPSRATLRDFYIHAPNARAIMIENADQPGGRILADQLNTSGPGGQRGGRPAALRVNGLDQTDVLLRCLQGSGNSGVWVEAVGGANRRSGTARNQVSIFTGATGSAVGQYNVRSGGHLVVRGVYHEKSADALRGIHLADTGTLAIDATRFSYATSPAAPLVAVNDFQGLFTLATGLLMPVDSTNTCRIEITGNGGGAHVLALNNQFWVLEPGVDAGKVWSNRATPPASGGLVGCNMNSPNKEALKTGFAFLEKVGDHADVARSKHGSAPLDNRGTVSDAALLRHLAPFRDARVWLPAPAPKGATDVRIHRVMASGGADATVEFRSRAQQ